MQVVKKLRCLLLDVDGTIVRGQNPTPGAKELFPAIEQSQRSFLIVTNNNSISLAEHARRLRKAQLPVGPENILSSGEVAAEFLRRTFSVDIEMRSETLWSRFARHTGEHPGIDGDDEDSGAKELDCFSPSSQRRSPDLLGHSGEVQHFAGPWPGRAAITVRPGQVQMGMVPNPLHEVVVGRRVNVEITCKYCRDGKTMAKPGGKAFQRFDFRQPRM